MTNLATLRLAILLSLLPAAAAADAQFSHDDWTAVLERHVDERGFVAYDALAADHAQLDDYVSSLEATSPESDPALFPSREQRLAYWINAYNAQVFTGVLERGPERESVWKGGLVSGYGFFVKRKITLGGRSMSLKHLEDDIIRAGFEDPRIHAALNCASISCPRLPREAFPAEGLDERLDAAMREFVDSEANVEVLAAARTVRLSKIFDWFRGDFLAYERAQGVDKPSLLDYVNRYREEGREIPSDYRVEFIPYDKGINSQR